MSKDPAFLFYPNDYIGGTMGMSLEEKGAYIEILMMQFNRGHMTEHMIRQTIGQIWDTIQVKFIQDDKGLWYNSRLEEEKEKRKKYVQSRNNNRSGVNQYTKKGKKDRTNDRTYVGHKTSHMENENENENEDINTITINAFVEFFKENGYKKEAAEKAYHYYNDNGWKDKNGTPVKNWKNKCRNNWFKSEYKIGLKKLAI